MKILAILGTIIFGVILTFFIIFNMIKQEIKYKGGNK